MVSVTLYRAHCARSTAGTRFRYGRSRMVPGRRRFTDTERLCRSHAFGAFGTVSLRVRPGAGFGHEPRRTRKTPASSNAIVSSQSPSSAPTQGPAGGAVRTELEQLVPPGVGAEFLGPPGVPLSFLQSKEIAAESVVHP